MTFLEDVLGWMRDEEIHEHSYLPKSGATIIHEPTEVVNVFAYGSDYANGDTEGGFTGDTEVRVYWKDVAGVQFVTDIVPGDQMASLWTFMIKRWSEGSSGDG